MIEQRTKNSDLSGEIRGIGYSIKYDRAQQFANNRSLFTHHTPTIISVSNSRLVPIVSLIWKSRKLSPKQQKNVLMTNILKISTIYLIKNRFLSLISCDYNSAKQNI